MATATTQPDQPDQRSAGLTINLSSNNPFRNRAASPASLPQSPASPFDDPPPRPVSRNPFLDPNNQPLRSPPPSNGIMATKDAPTAEDLFGDLSLEDKKSQPALKPTPANRSGPPRGENMPPPGRRGPPPNHRPTRSQEEALRARRRENGSGSGISPQRRMGSRPRRNSESSVADPEKPMMTAEEKKARDLRRQERERRHREKRDKTKPPNKKLDLIDRLDATSIFGTGLFHHDGPFDAVNPHRNKNGRRNAPMQAFPKDSLNMSIGGSGPLNKRPDHATFMGNNDKEAYIDYSTGADKVENPQARPKNEVGGVWDPKSRGSILHGDETLGLGTSTFLEGTPAARTAIQRREQETAQEAADGGLQRKKSLAQRIRNINRPPRGDFPGSGRMTNPEGVYQSRRSPTGDYPTSTSVQGERNPFFAEYDTKKGEEQISVRKPTSPSSPPRFNSLERRATTDATSPTDDQPKQAGGLLGRMKSLKGSRRPRQTSDSQPPPPGTAA